MNKTVNDIVREVVEGDGECDVCEAKYGEPHCNCGNCDCKGEGERMKYYKCEKCWESLAQYKDSDLRNCENDNCELGGLNQVGKEIEEWEVA
jgi:hypothetical protein